MIFFSLLPNQTTSASKRSNYLYQFICTSDILRNHLIHSPFMRVLTFYNRKYLHISLFLKLEEQVEQKQKRLRNTLDMQPVTPSCGHLLNLTYTYGYSSFHDILFSPFPMSFIRELNPFFSLLGRTYILIFTHKNCLFCK